LIPESAPPPPRATQAPEKDRNPVELDIDRLIPNPRQPRTVIDDLKLEDLAQSIRANGVIQPVVVRKSSGSPEGYEIIAGERRWRAAQRAGLLKVPVVVKDVPDDKLLEVALIENIQRENLNPIEEALAYRRLADEHHMSQDEMSSAVGKDRATISNYMRLLKLPVEVRNDVAAGTLAMGHARAILGLGDEAAQRRVAREAVSRSLSVRETESLVRKENEPKAVVEAPRLDANSRAAEEKLRLALGTRVRIVRKGKGGRLEIDFVSEDELQRIYEQLTEG
jgi:ParB family chromosome partitioning protein